MKKTYRNTKIRPRKWLCAVIAITAMRIVEVVESATSAINNYVSSLVSSVSFFDKSIKTFSTAKELISCQNIFKTHWNYWQKTIETRENVGAVFLPPKGEI
ncbi:MAG: hypothetical protein ACTH7L_14165 [Psychrobacter alimentarius]